MRIKTVIIAIESNDIRKYKHRQKLILWKDKVGKVARDKKERLKKQC